MEARIEEQKRKEILFVRAARMDKDEFEKKVLLEHFDLNISDYDNYNEITAINNVKGNHKDFIFIGHFKPYLKHYEFYYGKKNTDELYVLTKDNKYKFHKVEKENLCYDSVLNFLVDRIPPDFMEVHQFFPWYDFNFECFRIKND